jgi:putative glycosyltransferase (TIGR04372 family)
MRLSKLMLRVLGVLSVPYCTIRSMVELFRHLQAIRSADVVAVRVEGGFGHLITAPDVLRRLNADKRVVFLMISEAGRHNFDVKHIWRDIVMIDLPASVIAGAMVPQFNWGLAGLACWFVRAVKRDDARLIDGRTEQFYYQVPDLSGLSWDDRPDGMSIRYFWPINYFRLIEQTSHLPAPRIPEEWKRDLDRRLQSIGFRPDRHRLATLYLRQKGNDHRCGSPFEWYVPALRLLAERGYFVLFVGDVSLPVSPDYKLNTMIADHRAAGTTRDRFYLYSVLSSALFIGECGGGVNLPGFLGEIPCLFTNAFPFGFGLRHSWVYPKRLRNACGTLVPWRQLFSDHLWRYDFPEGVTLECNTADEIHSAVAEFLDAVADGTWRDLRAPAEISKYTQLVQGRSGISPSWFAAYGENLAPIPKTAA